MKRQDIIKYLHALGATDHGGDKFVMTNCPFALYTHEQGTDYHPSMGLSVLPGRQSKFMCYTCGKHGSLLEMLYMLRMIDKDQLLDIDYATAQGIAEEDTDDQLPQFAGYEEDSTGHSKLTVFPDEWLNGFPNIYKHPYLVARKVLPWVATELDIRFDPGKKRVCFPFRDPYGRLIGMQGRDATGKSDLRYLTYRYKKKANRHVWLGEDKADLNMPLVLTEGPMDYARIYQVYPNVLASAGGLSLPKLKRIQDALQLITLFDYGTGGNSARKKVDGFFSKVTVRHIVPSQQLGDAGNMPPELISNLIDQYLTKVVG